MFTTFGGHKTCTIRNCPEGAVIEVNNDDIYLKDYKLKKNYYGETCGIFEFESFKIGKVKDYFYENGKLMQEGKIIDGIVHTAIYEIGFFPDATDFFVEESLVERYEEEKNNS